MNTILTRWKVIAQAYRMEAVKLSEAKRDFVLLPRCWVVECSQIWVARLRRLARDYEQLAETLRRLHVVAFAMLMLKQLTKEVTMFRISSIITAYLFVRCALLASIPFSPIRIPLAIAEPVIEIDGISDPVGGWAYFKFPDAEQGFATKYLPTRNAKSRAQFVGLVTTPADGVWGGAESPEEDTVYVFMTVVQSTQPVMIPLVWSGDGGLAVFVNGVLIGGGDPGAEIAFDLIVRPKSPVLLELAAHPTPGPWAFALIRRDTYLPLTSTPGVTTNACMADVPWEVCNEAGAGEADQASGAKISLSTIHLTARGESPHPTVRITAPLISRQAPGFSNGIKTYAKASVACSMAKKTTTLSAAVVGQDLAEAVSVVLYQNANYYAGAPRVFVSTDSGWLVEFDVALNYKRKLYLNAPLGAHQITADAEHLYAHIRDNNHEILKIKPEPGADGSTLRIVGRTGSLNGTGSPEGFVFLGGKLYVAIGGPTETGKIVKIDQTTMTVLGSWPIPASDNITCIENHGFATNGANLFILALPKRDVIKARFYKVSQSLSQLGSSLQLPGPSSGLKGGRGGNLYACFSGTCSIYTAPDKLYRINPSNLTIRNSSTYSNRSHWLAKDANWIYRLGPDDPATGYDLIEAVHPTTLDIVYRINTGAPVLHHGIVQGGYLWVTHETSPRGVVGRYTLYPASSLCGDQVP